MSEEREAKLPAELVGLLAQTAGRPWALRTEAMEVLLEALSDGVSVNFDEELDDMVPPVEKEQGVAVVPLHGVITPSAPGLLALLLGIGGGLDQFKSQLLEAAGSSDVQHIVLDVNSPGGLIDMVPETAALIREVRDQKPVTAVANPVAGSAGYWLAAQGNELIATPSGEVGSIGAYMLHADQSRAIDDAGVTVTLTSAGKYKTEGNKFEPLSASAKEARQAKVDAVYGWFVDAVAAGRGVDPNVVANGYGEGRMLWADDALSEGMVDRVATLDEVVQAAQVSVAAQRDGGEVQASRKERAVALL